MRVYVTFHREPLITNVASVRSLSGMTAFVHIQTALLSEPFQAHVALKWLLACMRSKVNLHHIRRTEIRKKRNSRIKGEKPTHGSTNRYTYLQIRFSAKTDVAHRTVIRFVSGMLLHVYVVRRGGGENFTADVTGMGFGFRRRQGLLRVGFRFRRCLGRGSSAHFRYSAECGFMNQVIKGRGLWKCAARVKPRV